MFILLDNAFCTAAVAGFKVDSMAGGAAGLLDCWTAGSWWAAGLLECCLSS